MQGAVPHPELPPAYIGQPRPAEPYAIGAWCKIDRERHSRAAGAETITIVTELGELSFAHCRWHVARVLAQAFRDCGNAFGLERAAVSTSIPDRKRRKERPIKPDQCPEFEERFLSVAAIAQRLGVSEKTIRRKIDRGELPAHRVGRLLRVGEGALAAYVARACLSKGQIGS